MFNPSTTQNTSRLLKLWKYSKNNGYSTNKLLYICSADDLSSLWIIISSSFRVRDLVGDLSSELFDWFT